MKRIIITGVLICGMMVLHTLAQDKIVFIDGRIIPATDIVINDDIITYHKTARSSAKQYKAQPYNVFAIEYADGTERLIYAQDTMSDDLNIEQMRMFVRGQQDAVTYYNKIPVIVASAIVGVASGPTLKFFGAVPPALFATFVGAASPNMSKQHVSDKAFLDSPEYNMGYEAKVRNIKIRRALVFGLGGFVVSYAAFYAGTQN